MNNHPSNASPSSPEHWIDLARYPITRLETPEGRALLAQCRADIRRAALCQLPCFLTAEAVEALAAEARAIAPRAVRRDSFRSAYGWMDNSGFPKDHPRAWPQHDRKGTVHYDLYPPDALIRRLYKWEPLTRFIGASLEEERFHICDDPYMSVVLSVMRPGDVHGWHFDTNDYAITLCLQSSEGGGEFACAPYVRSDEDEHYDVIAELFSGQRPAPVSVSFAAGTFTLFRGRQSLHRVNTVQGDRDRLMAIFSYHREPGFRWPEQMIRMSKYPAATTAAV